MGLRKSAALCARGGGVTVGEFVIASSGIKHPPGAQRVTWRRGVLKLKSLLIAAADSGSWYWFAPSFCCCDCVLR